MGIIILFKVRVNSLTFFMYIKFINLIIGKD